MIYIDYSECKMSEGTTKSGGYNYIYHVLELLDTKGISSTVLVPKGFEPDEDEKKIFKTERVTIYAIDSLATLQMQERSTLFIPLLPVAKMSIIDQIKKNNSTCKVYITIHGVRRLDLKYDMYDKFYYEGLKKLIYPITGRLSVSIGNIAYKYQIRKNISKYDKVFTVSNATLQQLVRIGTPQFIKWFYQGENIEGIDTRRGSASNNEKYILFLSGNRPEKNLLRFMVAFLEYKKRNNNEIHLYITGVNKKKKANLMQCKMLDKSMVDKWISFLGYVQEDALNELYYNALYIAYPSKSEGFGLPVEEAVMRGIPVVASYVTSIPEVVDSTIAYMNPYSVESMVRALEKMDSKELTRQVCAIHEKKEIVVERIKQCNNDLISELMEFEVAAYGK